MQMDVRGYITYCDRCGFKIFRKAEEKTGPTVVWWTPEELPEGWEVFGCKHLCPVCSKLWNEFTSNKEVKK